MKALNIYEHPSIQETSGETIRPGGFHLTSRALRFCRFSSGDLLIDVGCGNGASIRYIREKFSYKLRLSGVDSSRFMILKGRKKNSHIFQAIAENLPYRDGIADGVLFECVLSLAKDKSKALKECHRILKENGFLIITDLYLREPPLSDLFPCHQPISCINGAVSSDELIDMVKLSGFQIELWEDHTAYLKEFAGNLIFAHGSMEEFWSQFCEHGQAKKIQAASAKVKPGYFLLIAKKRRKHV